MPLPNRKLGKLAPRYDRRTVHFGDYAPANLNPPMTADWTVAVKDWGMLGNDTVGDCTCAAAGHDIDAWIASVVTDAAMMPDGPILAAYKAISGWNGVPDDPSDTGACLLDVLNYWRQTGIAGHTIGAYIAVRPSNTLHVKAAIAFLEGLYIGLQLPDAWLSANPGDTWDIGDGVAPNPANGHCVTVLGYDQNCLLVVSWGAVYKLTWAAFMACCDEAYALVSEDELDAGNENAAGLNLVQLDADLNLVAY
jgi:hypothetical protein